MDELHDLILSTKKKDTEKLKDYFNRVKPIQKKSLELFIEYGGTVEKIKGVIYADLDGYTGWEPFRGDMDYQFELFLAIYRWATTRLNDKLYHSQ